MIQAPAESLKSCRSIGGFPGFQPGFNPGLCPQIEEKADLEIIALWYE